MLHQRVVKPKHPLNPPNRNWTNFKAYWRNIIIKTNYLNVFVLYTYCISLVYIYIKLCSSPEFPLEYIKIPKRKFGLVKLPNF